jgi:hypothetical protein
MHPNVFTELHKVRHRSGLVMTPRGDIRAGSGVWIDNSAVSVGDQAKVSGLVVQIFADNLEVPERGSPPLSTGSDRRDESEPAILKQTSSLLAKINDHLSLLST